MEIEDKIIAGINAAKEDVIRGIIEKIEGRPAELSDAQNIILASYPPHISPYRWMVIYQNVHIGFFDVDLVGNVVTFTPIAE